MAWALLCALLAATAEPLSFDRAVDVEVAWDLIDLPFTIDAQLLSKKSPLLLQDWHSDDDFGFGTPLDKELQALHQQFTSILTNADKFDAAHTAKPNPHLRGAVLGSHPLASSNSVGWFSPHFDEHAEPSAAARRDDEDSPSWEMSARLSSEALEPRPLGSLDDHEDSPRWDLSSGRRARPAASDSQSSFSPDGQPSKQWKDFETRFGSSDAISAFHSASPRESPVASAKRTKGSKKPLVWIHLHKAGGSFMCQMAKRNEKVVFPESNCNWRGHDGYEESGKTYSRVPCAERARTFHSRGFTYGQVEREMDTDEVCDEFRYGVMLREPMSLMHSLMNYEIWYNEKFAHQHVNIPPDMVDWLKGKIESQEVPGAEHLPWVHMDNFQTRVLANAFDVPAGKIGAEHLDRARAFLQNNGFMVQILEDLPQQGEALFNELGWKWQPGALHRKVNALEREERPFMPQEKEYLKDLNKYDFELYNAMRSSE
jgi:hypothetical protein